MNNIHQLIQSQAWGPLLAVVITMLLAAWRSWAGNLWLAKIPRAYQWVPPVVVATLAAVASGIEAGEPWLGVLILAGQAGMGAIGLYHTAKRVVGK